MCFPLKSGTPKRVKLSMPCTRVLTRGDIPLDHSKNHLQNTWHFVSDLQWRGVSIQISSFRTRLNIDTPLHCKSDINYHLFCKYNLWEQDIILREQNNSFSHMALINPRIYIIDEKRAICEELRIYSLELYFLSMSI